MELVCTLNNLTLDFVSGKPIVSFLCESKAALRDVEDYKDKRLRVEVKQYREKRSLDANSYYWVLMSKLADMLRVSKPFMHNFLLRRYGQPDMMDGKVIEFILREELYDEVDQWSNIHLYPTTHVTTMQNGQQYRLYYKLKDSHEMDSAEFSKLLDGTISECKESGIEVATPEQIARMKALMRETEKQSKETK